MKTLPAKERYKCDFCKRKPYQTKNACRVHEDKCFGNPNRNCPTCKNTGKIDEVMSNGYMGHQNYPCPSCQIAREKSGKDYTSIVLTN